MYTHSYEAIYGLTMTKQITWHKISHGMTSIYKHINWHVHMYAYFHSQDFNRSQSQLITNYIDDINYKCNTLIVHSQIGTVLFTIIQRLTWHVYLYGTNLKITY